MNHINYFSDYKMNYVQNLNSNIEDTETGFLKGNMFKDLYDPYKNYQPQVIKPRNEKERLMYEIAMYGFGMNDLVLYLDTNPQDQNALTNLIKEIRKKKPTNKEFIKHSYSEEELKEVETDVSKFLSL